MHWQALGNLATYAAEKYLEHPTVFPSYPLYLQRLLLTSQ